MAKQRRKRCIQFEDVEDVLRVLLREKDISALIWMNVVVAICALQLGGMRLARRRVPLPFPLAGLCWDCVS